LKNEISVFWPRTTTHIVNSLSLDLIGTGITDEMARHIATILKLTQAIRSLQPSDRPALQSLAGNLALEIADQLDQLSLLLTDADSARGIVLRGRRRTNYGAARQVDPYARLRTTHFPASDISPGMTPATNGFLLSLSLCLDIGIVNIAMMTVAMQRGYWNGFWLGMGSCIGDLIYAMLALAGMTALLQFTAVRWVMWLGGTVVLIVLAAKMARSAFHSISGKTFSESDATGSNLRQLLRGMLLALSSPSAIVWFAAVGGALIAQSGVKGWVATGSFLAGFFVAGVAWTCSLCLAARQGGKAFGARALSFCYFASAALFVFFGWQVVTSGYRSLILGLPT
jgi:L-lysine exporter family protein LysE/ArgO